MKNIRQDILFRARLISLVVLALAVTVGVRLWIIQQVDGEKWRKKAQKAKIRNRTIPAIRGNIYAADGSLLATSLPYYKIGLDLKMVRDTTNKKLYSKILPAICNKLSTFLRDRSAKEYNAYIQESLANKSISYILLSNKTLDFQQKQTFERWAVYDSVKFHAGIVFDPFTQRYKPFDNMAQRTIGEVKPNEKGIGLEAFFNKQLAGVNGKGLYERLGGGSWRPVGGDAQIRPEPGMDLYTTLDVNIQDVAESSLRHQLKKYNAKYGCVIVMEVATGHIKAIANLNRITDSVYAETFNHALVGKCDPGSIFKVPTMVALLEEAKISLNDSVRTGTGSFNYKGKEFKDDHPHGTMTVKQVLGYSSNVGVFKLMQQHFFTKPERYTDYYLKQRFRMGERVGVQLRDRDPEPMPTVKDPISNKRSWSPLTLPQMAIGYEVDITPLQMLTFYNALANNGIWVQPIIVKEIRLANEVVEDFTQSQQRSSEPICSPETLKQVIEMMEGVVLSGTARKIYSPYYRIAGKTGTAVVLENGRYQPGRYHTSFAGFFPANQPKYSCIVVVHEPHGAGGGQLMAAEAAAPVFGDIANKIYASDIQMHKPIQKVEAPAANERRMLQASYTPDAQIIASTLQLKSSTGWQEKTTEKYKVPNLIGLSLRDALYILENKGFRVSHQGKGKVVEQSVKPGLQGSKNQLISLSLN